MTNTADRIAKWLLVLTLVGVGALVALWFLGPRSHVAYLCRACGAEREAARFLGVQYVDRRSETDLSRWYRESGLRSHSHDWTHSGSSEQQWGGATISGDSFGLQLSPLKLLRSISVKHGSGAIRVLAPMYYQALDGTLAVEDFRIASEAQLESNQSTPPNSLSGDRD